jgi:hypothetical protein
VFLGDIQVHIIFVLAKTREITKEKGKAEQFGPDGDMGVDIAAHALIEQLFDRECDKEKTEHDGQRVNFGDHGRFKHHERGLIVITPEGVMRDGHQKDEKGNRAASGNSGDNNRRNSCIGLI